MDFRILGPVEVLDDAGEPLGIGGARERALLARLLLSANQVVSTDRLVEELWGAECTAGAVHALRVHMSRLRKGLRDGGSDDVLVTRPHGYLLRCEPDAIDAARFGALLTRARRQAAEHQHAEAAQALREALAQWRGPALADVVDAPFVHSHAAGLEESRLAAVEQRIEHDLACGHHAELVGELAQLTTMNPFRERLWSARMLALYRSGRRAEALAAYHDLRGLLQENLGLEPGSALTRLQRGILTQDPTLEWFPSPPDEAHARSAPQPAPSARRPPATRYARNDGVNIAYQVLGDGPVDIVLVPGFVSNLDLNWDNPGWRQVYERLASFSRLIVWDKRGTGLSDPVHRVPTLDERVDDLLAVMDAAGSQRATLLGVSEGGPMSLLFAASYPERMRGLVLYGVSPRFSQTPDWPWGWSPARVADILAELDTDWGKGALLELFAPTAAGNPKARDSWGRMQRAGASPAMGRAVMEAMVAIDCRNILSAICVPTLLLHRQDDQVAHVAAARYIADHVPGARLVEFPGADHLWTMGPLDPILDQVEDFATSGVSPHPSIDRILATLLVITIVHPPGLAPDDEGPDSHQALVQREVRRFHGREVARSAQGSVFAFMSPSRAIACIQAIKTAVTALGLELSAGVHTGECLVAGDDLSGPAVDVATEVAALARHGETLVTSTVKDLTAGAGVIFRHHDVSEPEGVPDELTLYAVDDAVHVAVDNGGSVRGRARLAEPATPRHPGRQWPIDSRVRM